MTTWQLTLWVVLSYGLKISASPIYEIILLQQILHNTTSEKNKVGMISNSHTEKREAGDTNVWIDKRDSVIWKTSESENVRSVKKRQPKFWLVHSLGIKCDLELKTIVSGRCDRSEKTFQNRPVNNCSSVGLVVVKKADTNCEKLRAKTGFASNWVYLVLVVCVQNWPIPKTSNF